MRPELLHVVTAIANPVRWESRIRLARDAIREWLNDGVHVYLVECAYGDRPHDLTNIDHPNFHHIGVRARTLVWNKECLINIGIARVPHDAKHIGTFDADIHFRDRQWAQEAVHELQLYPVIQPWSDCYDLGPRDQHIAHHVSFCRQFFHGQPVIPGGKNFWKSDSGPYLYPHSGYAWCWNRNVLDETCGLLEVGGMGSGDHHCALSLVGAAHASMPKGTSEEYARHVYQWQARALKAVNKKIGFTWGTIEHAFHGKKADRKYVPRWDMFVKHQFSPFTDLIRNSYGVLEFAGNKPALEREFDNYMRSRAEDTNSLN